MKGDKVLISSIHKKKAKLILNQIKPKPKMILAIGGESGTGKTEVACVLRDLLFLQGYRVNIISLDDYYSTLPGERMLARKQSNYKQVGLIEIDWNFVTSILKRFLSSKSRVIFTQRTNRYTNSVESVQWHSGDVDILIVEGLYANYLKIPAVKCFLEGSIQDTKAFRVKRGKETLDKHREKILKIEKKEISKIKCFSTYIISVDGITIKENKIC